MALVPVASEALRTAPVATAVPPAPPVVRTEPSAAEAGPAAERASAVTAAARAREVRVRMRVPHSESGVGELGRRRPVAPSPYATDRRWLPGDWPEASMDGLRRGTGGRATGRGPGGGSDRAGAVEEWMRTARAVGRSCVGSVDHVTGLPTV